MRYVLLILTILLITAQSHASKKADRDTELYQHSKQQRVISTYFTSAVVKQIQKYRHAQAFKNTMDKYTNAEIEAENAVIKSTVDVFVPSLYTSATQNNGRIMWLKNDFHNNKHVVGLTIPLK